MQLIKKWLQELLELEGFTRHPKNKAIPERSGELKWRECIVDEGSFCYKTNFFEKMWDDTAFAIKHCLLPSFAEMDSTYFLPFITNRTQKKTLNQVL